ncbi:hypothetical protein Avbf_10427 [Armadillidium vulgare]|nr:hypothetical protein Avbf_10427 [Armadillidium vulgare]
MMNVNINNYAHEVMEEEFAQELLNSNPGSSIITKLDSHGYRYAHEVMEEEFAQELLNSNPGFLNYHKIRQSRLSCALLSFLYLSQ